MSSDPYIQEHEQRRRESKIRGLDRTPTLEVVQLENQKVTLARWQQRIIAVLSVVGGLTIVYVALNLIF